MAWIKPTVFITAVGNIGQLPNGRTSNLEECTAIAGNVVKHIASTMSSKILAIIMMMTYYIYKSWPNHVPAVAVIRGRQVLFVLNRFKVYLDGILHQKKGIFILEFYVRGWVRKSVEMKFCNTFIGTGKCEGNPLCKNWRWRTKALYTNRIRYPSSLSRKWWMPYVRIISLCINESVSIPPQ